MNRWRAEYDDGIWRFYRDGMELGLYEKGDVVIDALNNAESRIAELVAENERLLQLLHDEMSQLEIATDLGNKRWTALNKIYEDGEKHNANWCKRIAQEGLGIKNA